MWKDIPIYEFGFISQTVKIQPVPLIFETEDCEI
jgi:hypothetical protein